MSRELCYPSTCVLVCLYFLSLYDFKTQFNKHFPEAFKVSKQFQGFVTDGEGKLFLVICVDAHYMVSECFNLSCAHVTQSKPYQTTERMYLRYIFSLLWTDNLVHIALLT